MAHVCSSHNAQPNAGGPPQAGVVENDSAVDWRARCAKLVERVGQLERINEVLMDRVERAIDEQADAFSLFHVANALERQVVARTTDLNDALQRLESVNRELLIIKDAALDASRAKSAFLAAMSHELRTPMNGVVGMTELLLDTELDRSQRRSAEVIQRSALSLLRILNDILDFSKIEAGQMEVERVPFDIRSITDEALEPLRHIIRQKGLRLQLEWHSTIPQLVLGDPSRFTQILTNLLSNAIKFTASGTIGLRATVLHTEARTGTSGDIIRVDVTDTGIGITPEVLERLFVPFLQADSTTSRRFGGTGLGLAIVRRLSELMGGECGATSTEQAGSTFWFALPLPAYLGTGGLGDEVTVRLRSVPERAPAPSSWAATSVDRSAAPAPHVLVAEDNAVNQVVARGYLKALGCVCTVVSDGAEAVALLNKPHAFDLVLMDWQMPVLDGLEATRQVRAAEQSSGGRVPIIALTANAVLGDRERCLEAGMDDFLSKPFRKRELGELVDRWCRTRIADGS